MKRKLKLRSLYSAVGVLVIGALLPIFIKNNHYMMVLDCVPINIIVVLGLNLITGLTGQTDLGTVGIPAPGICSSALFIRYTNLAPWLRLTAAVIMGILIGKGLGYPSLRVRGVYLSLTTIGFGEAVRLLISNTPRSMGDTQGTRNVWPYNIGSYQIQSQKEMYYLSLVLTAIAFFIAWRITYSEWGRIFKSLRNNVEAAGMSGVSIVSCKIKVLIVASIFGTVVGAMYTHYIGYINPSTFNLNLSTNYVVILMIEGLGSVAGTIFGSAIVIIPPEVLCFPGNYYQIVFCSIILLGAIFFLDGWMNAATGLFMKMYQRISGKNYTEGGK